jgi:MFS family permease
MTKAAATLGAVFFAYAVVTVPTAALPMLVGAYADLLHYDIQAAGLLASIEAAGMVAGVLFTTLVIARPGVDVRKCMTLAIALFGAAQFASCLSPAYPLFAAARFLSGFSGSGLVGAMGSIYLAKVPSPGRAFAIYFGIPYTAGALALFALPRLLDFAGLSPLFAILAALALVALLSTRLLPRVAADTAHEAGAAPKPASTSLRRILAMLLIGSLFINYVGNGGLWIYWERIGSFLRIDGDSRSLALSLGLLSGIAGAAICTTMTRFASRFAGIVIGHLILVAGYCFPLFDHAILAYGGGAALLNAAVAFLTPFYFSAIAKADESGRLVTAALSASGIGYSVGPMLLLPYARREAVEPLLMAAIATALASLLLVAVAWQIARRSSNADLLSRDI